MPNTRQLAYSLALCAACFTVIATRVYLEFDRVRFRVITSPHSASARSVSFPLPDLSRLSGQPTAFIVRLKAGAEAADVAISLDDLPLARAAVPAQRDVRVDAFARAPSGPGHQLTITADRGGWQLTYLEVANVHGFSSGVLEFVIVPRERHRDAPVPVWFASLFAVGLLLLRPRPGWPERRLLRAVHRLAIGLVATLFTATLLADRVTSYKILLSLETFLICTAILYAEPLVQAVRWGQPHILRMVRLAFRRWGRFLPHAAVWALVLWSVGQFYRADTGFTTLVLFGSYFERTALPALRAVPHAVEHGGGYDGQFYAQLALDPLLRDPAIRTALDAPAYRGRRILLPWIAWMLGGGQPALIVQAFALLNVISWCVLAWLVLRWLPPGSLRPTLAWTACMLSQGLLTSLRESLPDGPSMLLIAVSVAAVERNRHLLAAVVLGFAGLARETNLVAGVMFVPDLRRRKQLAPFMLHGALAVTPLLLWVTYLWCMGLSAGAGARNFAAPFAEYVEKWRVTTRELQTSGWQSFAPISLLSLVSLTTQAVVLLWVREYRSTWWRVGIAYLALMVVLGSAVWEGYPGAVTRIVLPMTFAFNVLLPRTRWFWPAWILGNLNVYDGLTVIRAPWLTP